MEIKIVGAGASMADFFQARGYAVGGGPYSYTIVSREFESMATVRKLMSDCEAWAEHVGKLNEADRAKKSSQSTEGRAVSATLEGVEEAADRAMENEEPIPIERQAHVFRDPKDGTFVGTANMRVKDVGSARLFLLSEARSWIVGYEDTYVVEPLAKYVLPQDAKDELEVLRGQGYDVEHFFNIQHEAYKQNLHKLGAWMGDKRAIWSAVRK